MTVIESCRELVLTSWSQVKVVDVRHFAYGKDGRLWWEVNPIDRRAGLPGPFAFVVPEVQSST